jgi:hypothetical protein
MLSPVNIARSSSSQLSLGSFAGFRPAVKPFTAAARAQGQSRARATAAAAGLAGAAVHDDFVSLIAAI